MSEPNFCRRCESELAAHDGACDVCGFLPSDEPAPEPARPFSERYAGGRADGAALMAYVAASRGPQWRRPGPIVAAALTIVLGLYGVLAAVALENANADHPAAPLDRPYPMHGQRP